MKHELVSLISRTARTFLEKNGRSDIEIPAFDVEIPQNEKHGDYASNIAFLLASKLGGAPLDIAEHLVQEFQSSENSRYLKNVEAAPPGFINFRLSNTAVEEGLQILLQQNELFGTSNFGRKKTVDVEFISANPTGPLHMGNGRGAFFGDVLANVLEATGHAVTREYYMNDRGKQIDLLGESVTRRYLQLQGLNVPFPEECYQGEYIGKIASEIRLHNYKLNDQGKIEKIKGRVKELALQKMIRDIKDIITRKFKVDMDVWFSEREMYDGGEVDELLKTLHHNEFMYKKDDAWWMATTRFGDDKDRVLVKGDNEPTYFLSDIAYVYDKLKKRKFKKAIIILGADHHGYIGRLKAAAEALTGENDRVEILIMQMVRLVEGGIEIRMSKRKGKFITLEEIVDDVGLDVSRFFFLMHAPGTHMDFDMTLARDRSEKNPVFYVQYAHARIANILQQPEVKAAIARRAEKPAVTITHDAERSLVFSLLQYPDLLQEVAESYEVQRIPFYAMDIARKFHSFYTSCRVIDQGKIHEQRIFIVKATKVVLANVLGILGVSAPTRM